MKLLKGVPSPFWDETFTSWLARLCHEQFLSERDLREVFQGHAHSVRSDLDLLSGSSDFVSELPEYFATRIPYCFAMSSTFLTAFEKSNLYCPVCIELDIAKLRAPGWRRSWRVEGACVCTHHGRPVLLCRLEEPRYNVFNKSWLAFVEYSASPAAHLDLDFAFDISPGMRPRTINQMILHLTERVQIWYQRRVCGGREPHLHPAAARFLLYFWLWEDESSKDVIGLARQYVQPSRGYRRTSKKRRTKDIDSIFATAPVRHLAVAYWLLGIAYGVISEHEATFIKTVTRRDTLELPINIAELRDLGRKPFSAETMQIIRHEATANLTAEQFQQIEWALG